jgi:hypothetical protein
LYIVNLITIKDFPGLIQFSPLHQARNVPEPLIDHILLKDIQLGHAVILILREEFMKSWTHPGDKLRELGAE